MLGLKGTVPDCSSPSGGDPSVSWIAATSRRAALYRRLAVRVCVWVGEGWSDNTVVLQVIMSLNKKEDLYQKCTYNFGDILTKCFSSS